ncbi:DNA-binding transcriptional regulator, LysR family [Butyrivibrio proteoclasticus]|uniref:DNA-binding transcriptional regulator, LysR family n=1 Tax=Butyrivibrio proteoclasticus TaxID=43305 RepID=A0A1I5XTB6_9FIRM|nr:LysR family transcriptional regulator [Butyrivibrio proteoclasticus]SFQ35211.1 DNA-binding transcriptional regulator, LysR family [Butyrivibrio proteoclasticus]
MEIKNLRYFLAVAREENMSKAAEQLHVSQPTLSKTLKALEEELGKKLFVRHSFSISLTDEGMLLRDRAQDLVAMSDKIEQEFNSLDDITGGDIYFGLAESYQIRYLAREIYKLKEKYPNFTYHITSGDTEQVTEKLDKGILDFAVLCETPDSNKYEYVKFPEADVWGAIISSSHPLAKKKSIRVSDLVEQPLFVSEQSWNNEIKVWAKDRFNELKLEGSFRLSYNGSVFARENLGILLTFKDLINTEGTDMVFRPLSPELKSELHLIWNKYQTFTPIAEKFLEQIKKAFK